MNEMHNTSIDRTCCPITQLHQPRRRHYRPISGSPKPSAFSGRPRLRPSSSSRIVPSRRNLPAGSISNCSRWKSRLLSSQSEPSFKIDGLHFQEYWHSTTIHIQLDVERSLCFIIFLKRIKMKVTWIKARFTQKNPRTTPKKFEIFFF